MTQQEELYLTAQEIGTMHFEGTVEITDPCYDDSIPCRMRAQVKAGEYVCVAWEHTKVFVEDDTTIEDTRVFRSGIYLNGVVPDEVQMEKIGLIGVDSGLAGCFTHKPNYTRQQWLAFCDTVREGDAWLRENGFFTSTGIGDGLYDVLACRTDGEITALEIVF